MTLRKVATHPNGYELNKEKGWWRVAVPEPTTNLIKDPGFQAASPDANFTFTNATASTDTSWRAFGKSSRKISTTSPSLAAITTYTQSNSESVFTPSANYTWGFYTLGVAGDSFTAEVIYSNGSVVKATESYIASGATERHALSFVVPAGITTSESMKLKITKSSLNSNAFSLDAFQLEAKAYATTYIDGDLVGAGGSWLGQPYASASTRAANAPGGRIYDFKADFGFSVMAYQGAGMPGMAHQTSGQPVYGGQSYKKTLPAERTITLVGALEGRTRAEIEASRELMVRALAPDTTGAVTPDSSLDSDTQNQSQALLKLQHIPYTGSNQTGQPLETTVIYMGGLEGDTQGLFQDRLALQFVEFTPLGFTETTESYASLAPSVEFNSVHGAITTYLKRASGEWVYLPQSIAAGSVTDTALAEDVYHNLYVGLGGSTTHVVDKITTNPVTGEKIANTWTGFNAAIRAIAPRTDQGDVLVGGSFTAPQSYLARLTGTNTNAPFGPTLNGAVRAIWIDPATGYVWVGGDFTAIGGYNRLVVLDPVTGAVVTGGNFANSVYSIVGTGTARQAYVGFNSGEQIVTQSNSGSTTTAAAIGFPSYDGTGGIFGQAVGPDGTLYAVGGQSTVGGSGLYYWIAQFKNGKWSNLEASGLYPLYSNVKNVAVDRAGNVYAAGTYNSGTLIDGSNIELTRSMVKFDGTHWLPFEITDGNLNKILTTSDGRMLATVVSGSGTSLMAVTSVDYEGSAPAYPRIRLNGAGRLYKLVNLTTGAEIYLNRMIAAGETITLDFTPTNISITSNFTGSILPSIVSTSRISRFNLVPQRNGALTSNRIGLLFNDPSGVGTPTADITWKTAYWGVEGSVE
jgi:hypothetical protein